MKKVKGKKEDVIRAKPFEVRIEEVGGDQEKLVRKFIKKSKKHEILKPWFNRCLYFKSPSERRREKERRRRYELKKLEKINND